MSVLKTKLRAFDMWMLNIDLIILISSVNIINITNNRIFNITNKII